jgi:H+/Cl- antiporter ClcA
LKKIIYKVFIGVIFGFVGTLSKFLFTNDQTALEDLFVSKSFWTNALIVFLIGYVFLGNLLWATAHKNKKN